MSDQEIEKVDCSPSVAPHLSERLMMEYLPPMEGQAALVVSPGRAQLADHWLANDCFSHVTTWYLDLYASAVAAQYVNEHVNVVCSADLPQRQFDVVAIPVLKSSESELTCDLMQQAHQRLRIGGRLAMSVNNANDYWVHDQMRRLFAKVSCQRTGEGCVYWATKKEDLKKLKSYEAEFAFRDEGRMIHATSRPGVFAHRRIDAGARQLLNTVEVSPSDSVLDMGCGSGTLSLAVAFKTSGLVHGVDSNARAVECLERNSQRNGLTNVRVHLNADGKLDLDSRVDVALANPPYFGDDSISQHFIDTCIANLRPGGALLVVTKNPRWYHAYFDGKLDDVAIFEVAKYYICCGRTKS